MPTNFVKKKADRPARPESVLDPVVALKKAVGERSEEMDIERITIDQTLQVRSKGLDAATVERYRAVIQNGGELPPITVYHVQTEDAPSANTYLLAAGFHRIEAHRQEGRKTIFAVVRQGTREEAMIEAARSNLAHGLDLKVPDLRRALEILVTAGYYFKDGVLASNRVIASDLGVTSETIGVWLNEILTVRNLTVDLTRRWGKDGRVYEVENIQQAAAQRAEEERKRKDQERLAAQYRAEEEKLARYRASNVIFRAKFIADMLLHTPYNRNVAAKLKIDLLPENTPEEQKTFGYYVKAADRRFTISTDREMQFIRDFKSHKDYRWYQDVLASVTPAIWEQADAQDWTEDDMQQWLDGFKQRHGGPLPSAAPGMAQPKNPSIEIPQPKVLGRHYSSAPAAATEIETRSAPTYDCPVRVGQRVKVITTGEITHITAVEWVDVEWRLLAESHPDDYLLLSDVELVVPPAPDELDTNPAPCPFKVGDKVVLKRNPEGISTVKAIHQLTTGAWQLTLVTEHGHEFYDVPSSFVPFWACPFSMGDLLVYKPTGSAPWKVVGGQWNGDDWTLKITNQEGQPFSDDASNFELCAAVVVEEQAVVSFRTGDIVRDLQSGELVEVIGFGSDGTITVEGDDEDDEPHQYEGRVEDFAKYDTHADPPSKAATSNGKRQAEIMVEDARSLMPRLLVHTADACVDFRMTTLVRWESFKSIQTILANGDANEIHLIERDLRRAQGEVGIVATLVNTILNNLDAMLAEIEGWAQRA